MEIVTADGVGRGLLPTRPRGLPWLGVLSRWHPTWSSHGICQWFRVNGGQIRWSLLYEANEFAGDSKDSEREGEREIQKERSGKESEVEDQEVVVGGGEGLPN